MPLPGIMPPVTLTQARFTNDQSGDVYGAEVFATWQVTEEWRLSGSYSFASVNLNLPTSFPSTGDGWTPTHQFNLRSYWDLTDELRLDSALYYVDGLPDLGVPSYVRWDVQVEWEPTDFLRVSAGVQNILDDRHPEFRPELARPASESERLGYMALEVTF